MLVLTRMENEKVVIGDPAKPQGTVQVVSIRGERVRLAFDFPKGVAINRQEIADAIITQGVQKRGRSGGR